MCENTHAVPYREVANGQPKHALRLPISPWGWIMACVIALILTAAAAAEEATMKQPIQVGFGRGNWEMVIDQAAFSPRDCGASLVYDGKMWLSNGYYHGGILTRDLWHSTDGAEWMRVHEDTPYDGYSPLVVHDGKMWAVSRTIWTSTDGVEWIQVQEADPEARQVGVPVAFRGEIWTLGSQIWKTFDGITWQCVNAETPWHGRSNFGYAVHDDKLWILAGAAVGKNDPPEKGYPDKTTKNDVWCSEDGITWVQTAEVAPWAPRMWSPAISYAGKLWVIGGYDNVNARNLGDVWYTEDGRTWHEFVSEPAFKARHASSLYVYKGSLWMAAGNTWPVVNEVWRLTLPQPDVLDISVKVDFGQDLGQNFGTLFEAVDAQGRTVAGAGFPGLYNTTCRNDRRGLQFFVRPVQDGTQPQMDVLPRFSEDTGVYIGDINGHMYAVGNRVATQVRAWNPSAGMWETKYGETPLRKGDGEMHLGDGLLTFRDDRIEYGGKLILAAPKGESIHHVYYALGHLFFFHDRPGEEKDGAFTRVCALPWAPGQAADLADAIVRPTTTLHETTWAWGQVKGKVLTVTNWGCVLAFDGKGWQTLRERDGKSYQVYAALNYYDRLLLGHYPSGSLHEYDGEVLTQREKWPPAMPGVATTAREAQSLALYRGELYTGVWPWAELWRYDRESDRWSLTRRLFTRPPLTDEVAHPYEAEILAYNAAHNAKNVWNDWGQRATSMAVAEDALYIGTSNKGGAPHPPDYTFIDDAALAEYGLVHRMRLPGHLSCQVRWVNGPTTFRFRVADGRMRVSQDGVEIATAAIDSATALKIARITWGNGMFGPLAGKLSGSTVK